MNNNFDKIALPTKIHIVKALVFPVVLYGCESWTTSLDHQGKLVLLLSHFSRVRLFTTPWTAAYQAPPSMGFSRQEYGVGCHRLLQGKLSAEELMLLNCGVGENS